MNKKIEIKYVKLQALTAYENNPRKNEEAVQFVKNSIRDFGFKQPIIVDENNTIVCGHTRAIAAAELGIEEVPVIYADDLTDEQIKAFRLVDNKTAEFADWDMDKLGIELDELSGSDELDMTEYGFDLIEEIPEVEDDDFEITLPKEPKAKLGDIYQLGDHRLMCGDSTLIDNFDKLMGGGISRPCFH